MQSDGPALYIRGPTAFKTDQHVDQTANASNLMGCNILWQEAPTWQDNSKNKHLHITVAS